MADDRKKGSDQENEPDYQYPRAGWQLFVTSQRQLNINMYYFIFDY